MIKTLSALALAASLSFGATASQAADPRPVPPVTSSDRILGRVDAPVTVIEYASFTCNHCSDFHTGVLPAFKARYIDTGKVRLVFRDMPTQPTQISATAAAIGRCAVPDRFFDVARYLMNGRAAAFASGEIMNWFTGAIAVSGRTQAQIETCLGTPATGEQLNTDVQDAIDAGVTGTPSFFVNGRRIGDHSMESLSAAIDPLLRGR